MTAHGEKQLIVKIPTAQPVKSYTAFPHPPEGTALHIPFQDLGKAMLVK